MLPSHSYVCKYAIQMGGKIGDKMKKKKILKTFLTATTMLPLPIQMPEASIAKPPIRGDTL